MRTNSLVFLNGKKAEELKTQSNVTKARPHNNKRKTMEK